MTHDATALCEGFRKGLVERREFLKQLAVVTGSVVAASHVLSSLGFDGGLIQEARGRSLRSRRAPVSTR